MNQPATNNSPVKITADQHGINEELICGQAKSIVKRLLNAGYEAYLVGGCVRDLLLGIKPKDFDVATDAHPEEICALFDRSRIIGRRFQIVHVYHRREFTEVSTFRALTDQSAQDQKTQYANGRIVRDNTFGSIEEDARRRDFTINAMYYDLQHSTILDFCDGLKDIERRSLRMIGDPAMRYKEDPVRILRALRFKAKLGLQLAAETEQPIHSSIYLLLDVAKPRLFDELIKLFHGGYAIAAYEQLKHYGLLKKLLPATQNALDKTEHFESLILAALQNTDSRINQGKSVNPAFIFAILLWQPYSQALEQHCKQGMPRYDALWEAGRVTVQQQSNITAITKRLLITICEIWKMQDRLPKARGKKVFQLLQQPRFRAAYDFLCLRAQIGETDPEEAQWWTQIQEVNEEEQRQMVNQRTKRLNKQQRHKKKHAK